MSGLANAVIHRILQSKVQGFIVEHGGTYTDVTIPTTCPDLSEAISYDTHPASKALLARPDIFVRPRDKPTLIVDFKTSPTYMLESSNIRDVMPYEALQFAMHFFHSKYLGVPCLYITRDRSNEERAFWINHGRSESPEVLQLLCPDSCRYPTLMQRGIRDFLTREFPDILVRNTYRGNGSSDMMVLARIEHLYKWEELLADLL